MYHAKIAIQNKLCFLFNDNKKNLDIAKASDCKTMHNLDDAICVLVSLSDNGHQSKEQLFSNEDVSAFVIPTKCLQISENELVLFAKYKSEVRFGKLTID
jgi:hypothetical protein